MKHKLLLVGLLAISNTAFSDENELSGEKCKLLELDSCYWLSSADAFLFDNDIFASDGNNDDQNYTYGLIWSWNHDKAIRHAMHTDTLQKKLIGYDSTRNMYGFQAGIVNFTPDELSNSGIEFQDRPYASLVFVHSDVFRTTKSDDGSFKSSLGVGVTYGVAGLNIGRALQSGLHAAIRKISNDDRPVKPMGWDHQVSDGGEFTGKIDVSYHYRIRPINKRLDTVLFSQASLGYYSMARVGGVVKYGDILIKNTPAHSVTQLGNPVSAGTELVSESWKERFVFIGVNQVYMGFNMFLQCGFRSSDFCLENDQLEPSFYEWSAGYKWGDDDSSWKISFHGREAEHRLEKRRHHKWAGITYEFSPRKTQNLLF